MDDFQVLHPLTPKVNFVVYQLDMEGTKRLPEDLSGSRGVDSHHTTHPLPVQATTPSHWSPKKAATLKLHG
jgi:hypothetical protein